MLSSTLSFATAVEKIVQDSGSKVEVLPRGVASCRIVYVAGPHAVEIAFRSIPSFDMSDSPLYVAHCFDVAEKDNTSPFKHIEACTPVWTGANSEILTIGGVIYLDTSLTCNTTDTGSVIGIIHQIILKTLG